MSKTSPDFVFKQFAIWHDQCAMKVNTDGILLGAWTSIEQQPSVPIQRMVDIGTGTGLIALMLAQKTHAPTTTPAGAKVTIDAIEIDTDAATQAKFNVKQSPWQTQVTIIEQDVKTFAQQDNKKGIYDVLVCNPPYFSQALLGPNHKRNIARHNPHLSFSDLLNCASLLASEYAKFNVILPTNEAQTLLNISEQHGWYLTKSLAVSTVVGKPASRLLMRFEKKPSVLQQQHLSIRQSDNRYTEAFKSLCAAYYLKF